MSDCFQDESTAPGAKIPVKGDILLNAQRKTVKLKVTSLCDRPIQVCSLLNLLAMHCDMMWLFQFERFPLVVISLLNYLK